jgi:hypothetical protein
MLVSFLVALGFLTGGLLWMGPHLMNATHPEAGQLIYVILRVVVMFGFAMTVVWRHKRSIYHALSYTGFLIFVDQVILKNIWFIIEFRRHPDAWKDMSLAVVLYSNSFSYIVFLPLILLIAFLGAMAGTALNKRAAERAKLPN